MTRRESRPGEKAAPEDPMAADHPQRNATPRLCAGDALRRRRLGSYRLVPLESGHRDPWQPWRPETLSEQSVNGYSDAAQHLLALGLLPAPNVPAMRMLWRRGGDERGLVRRISERWEVA